MHIANQALFIDVASLLWAVSIEKAVGPDGKPIVPSRMECVDEGLFCIWVVGGLSLGLTTLL
jgi:hypothetical protein